MKVGDWVVRKSGYQGGWWCTCCERAGLRPDMPLRVDDVAVGGDPIFWPLNRSAWDAEKFAFAKAPSFKSLEDYL